MINLFDFFIGLQGLSRDVFLYFMRFVINSIFLYRFSIQVVEVGLPVLLLGGGGYNIPNSVK